MMVVDQRAVLRQVEGDYLLDYAIFTGAMREYVTCTLEERFLADKSDLHRRMFLLVAYREEYSAYEDLGAMLDVLLTHRQDETVPLVERLISYGPGQVALAKVIQRFAINTWQELYEKLGLDDLVPPGWRREYPDIDLEKVLRTAAHVFFGDCVRNQKKDGMRAFNKMKHGLLVVPNARRYLSTLIDAPAALFKTDDNESAAVLSPFSIYAVPMTDERLDGRLRSINFIQANLRLIATLHVIARHPDVIKRRGVANPVEILRTSHLADLLNFVGQVGRSEGVESEPRKFAALPELIAKVRRWVSSRVNRFRVPKGWSSNSRLQQPALRAAAEPPSRWAASRMAMLPPRAREVV
jgi:hypothetical protein